MDNAYKKNDCINDCFAQRALDNLAKQRLSANFDSLACIVFLFAVWAKPLFLVGNKNGVYF